MTNLLDSSPDADGERLREILERTRMGLREDLDELRGELADELEDFESRLHQIARQLPEWLDVPDNSLRTPFTLRRPVELEGTLLGPRTVAVVAGQLEDFIVQWLGDDGEIPVWQQRDDDNAIDQFCSDLLALDSRTRTAIDATETRADDGPRELEQILESIVFELESRRETDVEALEDLIQEGDVEPGRNARAEIAQLWEEQRDRVDQLREIWDDLLNLHHDGIRRTLEGLRQLRDLVERTRQGIEGAGLADSSKLSPPSTPDGDDGDDTAISSGSTSVTSPIPKISEPEMSAADISSRFVRDQTESQSPGQTEQTGQTTEIETDVELPSETEPMLEGPDDPVTDGTADSPSPSELSERAKATSSTPESSTDVTSAPGSESTDTTAGVSEPDVSKTAPTPENSTIEKSLGDEATTTESNSTSPRSVTETEQVDEPPSEPADADPATATGDADRSESSEPFDGSSAPGIDENGLESRQPGGGASADPPGRSSPGDEPRVRVRMVRTREGWHPVGLDEIAATLGPPVAVVAGLLIMSLLSLLEVTPNPMVAWDWALPASFGAMALIVVLPLAFRWRPMWDRTDFQVIRRGTIEEDVDLRVTADDQLVFDRTSWSLSELDDTELHDWTAPDDRTRGSLLVVHPPYHAPIHLVSSATQPNVDDPQLTADELPADAWRLPSEEFETIAELLTD